MMLTSYQILFSSLIFFLTSTLLTNSSHLFFRHKYLIDQPNFKISYYGLIAGLSMLLASPFLISCQLSFMKIIYLCLLFIASTYIFCEPCRQGGYHMVATYYLLLPFATLVFSCPELQTFTLALTVMLSLGRLGCFFAGCCHGERIPDQRIPDPTSDSPSFYMLYPDPKQQINQIHQVEQSYAEPTIIIEAILQSLLTLGCLTFPDKANFIYGFGSILIILFSKYRSSDSDRGESVKLAIVGCLLYLSACYLTSVAGVQCYRLPNFGNFQPNAFIPYILGALMVTYGLSNDLEVKKFSIFGVIMATSYFLSSK